MTLLTWRCTEVKWSTVSIRHLNNTRSMCMQETSTNKTSICNNIARGNRNPSQGTVPKTVAITASAYTAPAPTLAECEVIFLAAAALMTKSPTAKALSVSCILGENLRNTFAKFHCYPELSSGAVTCKNSKHIIIFFTPGSSWGTWTRGWRTSTRCWWCWWRRPTTIRHL